MGVMFYYTNKKGQMNKEDYPFKAIRCWDKGANKEEICKTYPEYVIIPNSVTQEELEGSSKFRTKRRLPCLSYYYKKNGTSLWRSAQNKGGITSRSTNDEEMLLKIGRTNHSSDNVVIFDARSKISAMANKVKKGGYEN
jgi:myotubularin-related protein 6/7/8